MDIASRIYLSIVLLTPFRNGSGAMWKANGRLVAYPQYSTLVYLTHSEMVNEKETLVRCRLMQDHGQA
jgi:hypothetical protein